MSRRISIPQMVFSTRTAEPVVSAEFNREIVARSPGIPEEALTAFTDIADLTFSVARQDPLRPIFAVDPVGDRHWIFSRFISIGRYRKSNHQVLVQGLWLDLDAAEALRGSPFLLGRDELTGAGLVALSKHPGRGEIAPLEVDPDRLQEEARRLEVRRLQELSRDLEALDPHFPDLFSDLVDTRDPVVVIADKEPDSRRLEWMWLHLHPADRLELPLHTWPLYDRPRPYRVVQLEAEDVPGYRRQRPEVRVWPRPQDKPRGGRRAKLLQTHRQKRPDTLVDTLDGFRLTHLSERRMRPLPEEDASLVLAARSGMKLEEAQKQRVFTLQSRGGNLLHFHVAELAETFSRGSAAFADDLAARLDGKDAWTPDSGEARAVFELIPHGDRARLWAFWGLYTGTVPLGEAPWQKLTAELLRKGLPPSDLPGFLDALPGSEGSTLAVTYLWPALLADAEARLREAAPEAGTDAGSPYWPIFLRRLHETGLSPLSQGADLERMLDARLEAEPSLGPAAAEQYRRLWKLGFELDRRPFAWRLYFLKWIPLLGSEDRSTHARRGAVEILKGDGGEDKALRLPLKDPRVGPEIWESLAAWLESGPGDAMGRWDRWRSLAESLKNALDAPSGASAGRFLARTAFAGRDFDLAATLDWLLYMGPEEGQTFRNGLWSGLEEELGRLLDREASPELAEKIAGALRSLWILRADKNLGRNIDDWAPLDRFLAAWGLDAFVYLERLATADSPASRALPDVYLQAGRWLEGLTDRWQAPEILLRTKTASPWCNLFMDSLLRRPPSSSITDTRSRVCEQLARIVFPADGGRIPARIRRLRSMNSGIGA